MRPSASARGGTPGAGHRSVGATLGAPPCGRARELRGCATGCPLPWSGALGTSELVTTAGTRPPRTTRPRHGACSTWPAERRPPVPGAHPERAEQQPPDGGVPRAGRFRLPPRPRARGRWVLFGFDARFLTDAERGCCFCQCVGDTVCFHVVPGCSRVPRPSSGL